MQSSEMAAFGDQVRQAREQRGWTQADLSRESGISPRAILDIENNRVRTPQRATRQALLNALSIDGDVDQERSDWPDDVRVILDIIGAMLTDMHPQDRLTWLRDVTKMRRARP